LPALLNRILGRLKSPIVNRQSSIHDPVPFGPRYALGGLSPHGDCPQNSGNRLTIQSGPLAGAALRIERSVSDIKADFAFYEIVNRNSQLVTRDSQPVAHCHFDRDPETGTETLWDIFIRSEFRHRSLTTLLIRFTFRELLASGRRHWFAIRKLMQVDSEAGRHDPRTPEPQNPRTPLITLRNLGIGLVALRLGFRPEPDIERMLSPGNVKAIQALPPDPPDPPGLLLRLGSQPGLLVAAFLDSDTGRPLASAEAYERFVSPRQLLRQTFAGQAIIGNVDYILPRTAIEPLAARLANDHNELRRFSASLRRGARRN
jgi:hypothetical protein